MLQGTPSLPGILEAEAHGRISLLYRQRHVLFLAGQKENVGLELWVPENATL